MVQVNRTLLLHVLVIVVLVGLDQCSKWLAVNHHFSVTLNQGISFGWPFLSGLGQMMGIGLILTLLTLVWQRTPRWYMTCILAGGWSNWIDRITIGAVIDWLPIPGTTISNNIADYWIFLGVVGWFVSLFISPDRRREK